jgi:hypothetical protein
MPPKNVLLPLKANMEPIESGSELNFKESNLKKSLGKFSNPWPGFHTNMFKKVLIFHTDVFMKEIVP